MKIQSAPIQGYTNAFWRNTHEKMFGGVESYHTPFLRVEHGEVRRKDVRDISPDNNTVAHLVPQILGSSLDETREMLAVATDFGYKEVDINLGCPYPPVARKHKGCGLLADTDALKSLLDFLDTMRGSVSFSFKMRLGMESEDEGKAAIRLIDSFEPSQITIHARLGKQQYKGECDIDSFERIIAGVSSKIVYNGDILDCAGIEAIGERFKNIDTVMIGRALLVNPALAREYNGGAPLSPGEWLEFISSLFYYYSDTLQGDAHILAKMKPYWEYAPEFVDRKVLKLVKKSVSVAKYSAAVDTFAASIR